VTVAGISAVSVISGQELAKRQDISLQKSAPSAQTQPLADHATAETPPDTVILSGSGQPQIPDVSVYNRYRQPGNRAAIAAYQAIQPSTSTEGGPPPTQRCRPRSPREDLM